MMWTKTVAAILGGGLVSISIMLNLNFMIPLAVDTRLLIGVLIAFPLWVAAMLACYASRDGVHAWQGCALVLLVSISVNLGFMLGTS